MISTKGRHIEIKILNIKISLKWFSLLKYINKYKVKRILKKIYKSKSIIVIGDSHTDIFSFNKYKNKMIIYGNNIDNPNSHIYFNYHKNFITYHLGAVTAFNSNNKNSSTGCLNKVKFLINNNFIPPKSVCICVFGEIDCRVHVQRQAEKQGISIERNIEQIIENYLHFLKYLVNNNLNIVVYAPIPSQPDNINIDSMFPRFGTQLERNKITKIFNQKLKEKCIANNYKFVSLFENLINEDFTTKQEFLNKNDFVHLGNNAYPMIENMCREIL